MRRTTGYVTVVAVAVGVAIAGMLIVALSTRHDHHEPEESAVLRATATAILGRPLTDTAAPVVFGDAVAVVARVAPAVVTVIDVAEDTSGAVDAATSTTGTGFIIDEDGHIVTNAHIVAGGGSCLVVYADGETVQASIVGADPVTDLAAIAVKGKVPGVVALGDSSHLRPGQPVLAIGSPLGAFTNSVTQGIVSALGRSVPQRAGVPGLTGLIQHDAAITTGNAGGPLLDFAGEVIGVNTVTVLQTANGQPAQGLFFAIPANTVRAIAASLIADGQVIYPYLGVVAEAVTPELAAAHGVSAGTGVLVVATIPGGPAEAAGIRSGDVITAIGGEMIDVTRSLTEVLLSRKPADTVDVAIVRDGMALTVSVMLGERPTL